MPEVSKSIFALSQERLSGYEGRGKSKDAMHRTVDVRSSCVGFRKDKRRTETAAKRKFLLEPRERFFRFLSVRRQKGTALCAVGVPSQSASLTALPEGEPRGLLWRTVGDAGPYSGTWGVCGGGRMISAPTAARGEIALRCKARC